MPSYDERARLSLAPTLRSPCGEREKLPRSRVSAIGFRVRTRDLHLNQGPKTWDPRVIPRMASSNLPSMQSSMQTSTQPSNDYLFRPGARSTTFLIRRRISRRRSRGQPKLRRT